MTYTERTRVLLATQAQLDKHLKDSAAETTRLQTDIARQQREIQLLTGGLDLAQIALARTVIVVQGSVSQIRKAMDYMRAGDQSQVRAGAVMDAIKDLAQGGERLRERYCGVKNYDGFGDQREDHAYGYGPKHGSIVFSVGLDLNARQRDLLDAEREAALYYLHNLARIQEAERVPA